MINDTMLPIGTMLHNGTYRIERQLGSGGFGNTYKVQKLPFEETYAMKEFFLKGINQRTDGVVTVSVADNKSTFESQKKKFTKEAMRLRKIKNEHIVHVEDFFECDGTAYYVMEYIDGESLAEMVNRTKTPLQESQLLHILDQLLDALQTIHLATPPLIHLDIKPGNIMCDKQGNIRLIDFGASKQFSTDENSPMTLSTMCYTPGYAPTEQTEQTGKRIGPWTDFYSLGATLYYLLTLRRPPSNTILIEEGEQAFDYPVPISEKMRQLIEWMMKPSRIQRPQSVSEIRQFLNKEEGAPEKPKPVEPKPEASDETKIDTEATHLTMSGGGVPSSVNEQTQYEGPLSQKAEKTVYDSKSGNHQQQSNKQKNAAVSEKTRVANDNSGSSAAAVTSSLLPKKWTTSMVVLLVLITLSSLAAFILTCYYSKRDDSDLSLASGSFLLSFFFMISIFFKKDFGLWGLVISTVPSTLVLFLFFHWGHIDHFYVTIIVDIAFLFIIIQYLLLLLKYHKHNSSMLPNDRNSKTIIKMLYLVIGLFVLSVARLCSPGLWG